MLASVATRRAVRELVGDLSEGEADFLREAVGSISKGLGPDGDPAQLLEQLASRPFCIRGATLIDPPLIAEVIRTKSQAVELDMAEPVLSSTREDHCTLYSTYLNGCFLP